MRHFLCTAAVAVTIAGTALADPKPQGSTPADPQTVANMIAGKSFTWRSCNGGVYYGGGWEALAYCNKEGPAVGIGTWRVDRNGTVCEDLTWYWQEGKGVGSKVPTAAEKKRGCHEHATAPDGVIWRHWVGEPVWWRLETIGNASKGFKYKRQITRLRKKLGV